MHRAPRDVSLGRAIGNYQHEGHLRHGGDIQALVEKRNRIHDFHLGALRCLLGQQESVDRLVWILGRVEYQLGVRPLRDLVVAHFLRILSQFIRQKIKHELEIRQLESVTATQLFKYTANVKYTMKNTKMDEHGMDSTKNVIKTIFVNYVFNIENIFIT